MSAETPSSAPAAAPAAPAGGDSPVSAGVEGGDATPADESGGGRRNPSKEESRAERTKRAVDSVLAKKGLAPEKPAKLDAPALGASTQPAAAPKAPDQPAGQVGEKPAETPAAAKQPEPAPTQPPVPTQRDVQEWIAKDRELYEAKKRAEAVEAEAKQAKERLDKLKSMNPVELLAAYGHTYEGTAEAIVSGKFKELTPEQLALKAHDERVAKLEAELDGYRTERANTEKRSKVEAQAKQLQTELTSKYSAQWPVLASLPDAGARIIELKEKFPDESYDAIATHLEKLHGDQVRASVSSDAVLKALLADEATKSRVLALLNIKSEQLAQQVPQGKTRTGNGPDAIPSTHASTPGRRTEQRINGRQARAEAAMAAAKRSQQARMG